MAMFVGLSSGPSHQVGSLPRPVQQLPNQAVLHVKYSHHLTERSCVQSLRHLTGELNVLTTFQFQSHVIQQSGLIVICKSIYILLFLTTNSFTVIAELACTIFGIIFGCANLYWQLVCD